MLKKRTRWSRRLTRLTTNEKKPTAGAAATFLIAVAVVLVRLPTTAAAADGGAAVALVARTGVAFCRRRRCGASSTSTSMSTIPTTRALGLLRLRLRQRQQQQQRGRYDDGGTARRRRPALQSPPPSLPAFLGPPRPAFVVTAPSLRTTTIGRGGDGIADANYCRRFRGSADRLLDCTANFRRRRGTTTTTTTTPSAQFFSSSSSSSPSSSSTDGDDKAAAAAAASSPSPSPSSSDECEFQLLDSKNPVDDPVERAAYGALANDILPLCTGTARRHPQQQQQKQRTVILLLGVSGGCDSVALFHVLRKFVAKQRQRRPLPAPPRQSTTSRTTASKLKLRVVHFDHRQRGSVEGREDSEFVLRDLCGRYGVDCTAYGWPRRRLRRRDDDQDDQDDQYDDEDGPLRDFSQASARQWRRTKMKRLLDELITKEEEEEEERQDRNGGGGGDGIDVSGLLVTGHHADDSDESLWLKAIRGSHVTNWRGMDLIRRDDNDTYDDDDDDDGDDGDYQYDSNDSGTKRPRHYYWVRPLLRVRKSQIVDYLLRHGYKWREDRTNKSDKYLRNRVRNELLPLLADLMFTSSSSSSSSRDADDDDDDDSTTSIDDDGVGQSILQKRTANISEQTRELREDLASRAFQYLEESGSVRALESGNNNDNDDDGEGRRRKASRFFYLPERPMELVHKEALYRWIMLRYQQQRHVDTSSSSLDLNASRPLFVSYEQVRRVHQQLNDYLERRQWRLNLGRHWDLVRQGDVLELVRTGDSTNSNDNDGNGNNTGCTDERQPITGKALEWSVVDSNDARHDETRISNSVSDLDGTLRLSLPRSLLSSPLFVRTTVADVAGQFVVENASTDNDRTNASMKPKLVFTPPWRNRPVKVKDFLRGQKVPLHLRGSTPIVVLRTCDDGNENGDMTKEQQHRDAVESGAGHIVVAAVYVPTKGEWYADAKFFPGRRHGAGPNKDGGDYVPIAIQLA